VNKTRRTVPGAGQPDQEPSPRARPLACWRRGGRRLARRAHPLLRRHSRDGARWNRRLRRQLAPGEL